MTLYQKLYCGCCCLDFVLLVFINATPLWLTYYYSNEYYLVGLWVMCGSKKCLQLSGGAYTNAIRALAISALIPSFVTLISSWDLLSHYSGYPLPEVLISSVSNSLTGICLMGAVMMTSYMVKLLPVVLTLSWNFYIGCFICVVSGILGVLALVQHIQMIAQRRRSRSLSQA